MNEKQLKYLNALLFALLGVYLVDQFLYPQPPKDLVVAERSPSSIQPIYDFSELEGGKLLEVARDRLLNSFKLYPSKADGAFVAQLGNFVLKGGSDKKEFACGFYSQVQLTFEAEDFGGEANKPEMIIEAPCQVGGNINSMEPIKIPVQKLLQARAADSELSLYQDGVPVKVKLSHFSSQWPKHWSLTQVKLLGNANVARVLKVEVQDKALAMDWSRISK